MKVGCAEYDFVDDIWYLDFEHDELAAGNRTLITREMFDDMQMARSKARAQHRRDLCAQQVQKP